MIIIHRDRSEIKLRPLCLGYLLNVTLKTDAHVVAIQLFFQFFANLCQQTCSAILATLPLKVFPLLTLLDFNLVDCQEIYAVTFEFGGVVSMSNEIEVHDIFGLHELAKDILT